MQYILCIPVYKLGTHVTQWSQAVHVGDVVDEAHIAIVQYSFQIITNRHLQFLEAELVRQAQNVE